jgi:quercetin dioxygenase-like cupin family protein
MCARCNRVGGKKAAQHLSEETMNQKLFRIAAASIAVALGFGLGVSVAQNTPPTENKGVKVGPPTVLDLGAEVEGVEGRQLRMRVITLEPSHKGRPAVAYVVQGTLTEHREGGGDFERRQGDSWSEGKEINHWAENKGSQQAIVVAVDVFKQ